jgi:hypothetical protein
VYVQAPKSDIFVVLLSISLGAILIGCLLLLLVWGRYDYSTTVASLFGTPQSDSFFGMTENLNKISLLVS